jgi:nucleotide-binding universal stress UspA family protein
LYERILLAYDGSVEGAVALREGALLAHACAAELFILAIIPGAHGLFLAESAHSGVLGQQIQNYTSLLKRAVSRLEQLGFRPMSRLVIGEPVPVIASVAKEVSADLVVVGHRAQGLITRWWSGSDHAYISDHVGCSLLIARNSLSDEAFDLHFQTAS